MAYLEDGGVNKSVQFGILNQKWPPDADNCSFNNTCPVISHSAAFPLNTLGTLSHTGGLPPASLPWQFLGTDSYGKFGSTFKLAGYQDYHFSAKLEDKDSFIKKLHLSLMNLMPLVNWQEFNVLFLLWLEQLFLMYFLAGALLYGNWIKYQWSWSALSNSTFCDDRNVQ